MVKDKNEVAVKEEALVFDPSSVATDIFDVNDNIKGVTGRIPQIKIMHRVEMFANQAGEKFSSFKGIILHHSPTNAYWENDFSTSGGGTPPECASTNGEYPDSGEKKQCKTCFKCTQNTFGSGKDGKGKACKNLWRLHILVEGQQIPKRLTLPPSNIGVLQDFLVDLRDVGVPHELAILEFTLIPEKSKSGIEYSLINIKPIGTINNRQKALELKKIKDDFSAAFGQEIDGDEFAEGYPNAEIVDEKNAKL